MYARTTKDPGSRSRLKRRLVRLTVAVAAVAGAIGAMATPASAAQTCTGETASNVCLSINQLNDGTYAVHVGIDVHMSLAAAQEYIDDQGDPFQVVVKGDDKFDDTLFSVPRTALSASSGSGLSGDFDVIVFGFQLDEDHDWWDNHDEVYAWITLTDTDTGNSVDFGSNQITGYF